MAKPMMLKTDQRVTTVCDLGLHGAREKGTTGRVAPADKLSVLLSFLATVTKYWTETTRGKECDFGYSLGSLGS